MWADLNEKLEQPLKVSQFDKAIDNLKLVKAPGADVPCDLFWKAFKDQLAYFLHRVYSAE